MPMGVAGVCVMSKSSGCILILAGLAVAAYALYPQPQGVPEIATAHSAASATKVADKPADPGAFPAVSPAPKQAPEAAPGPDKGDKGGKSEKSGPAVPSVAPPALLVPPVPVPAKRPRTAVAAVEVDAAPPRVPVGESKTLAPPLDGAGLIREIQRHLKRIGCYRGEVTGVWSPSVRQAMRAFTQRANATLPVDEPDPVLLAMVQGHAPGACSATCPEGEDRAANGRCVPSALVAGTAPDKGAAKARTASADSGKKRPGAEIATGSAPPTAQGPTDGRMSLAGPPVADTPKAKRPRAVSRRHAKSAGLPRSVQRYPRDRRAQRPPSTGYPGLPRWAVPFLMPWGQ
jgi:peptidoglycan hydrolase-like protein with peptidoglycan-binding domain